MIVDPSIAMPISYPDPTFAGGLHVRANIIDMSGPSPVLEATVVLVEQPSGGLYLGKYVFTNGKPYSVEALVYVDPGFAAIDQGYGQITTDIQCLDLKTALIQSNLDAKVSTLADQDSLQQVQDSLSIANSDAVVGVVEESTPDVVIGIVED